MAPPSRGAAQLGRSLQPGCRVPGCRKLGGRCSRLRPGSRLPGRSQSSRTVPACSCRRPPVRRCCWRRQGRGGPGLPERRWCQRPAGLGVSHSSGCRRRHARRRHWPAALLRPPAHNHPATAAVPAPPHRKQLLGRRGDAAGVRGGGGGGRGCPARASLRKASCT